MSYESIGTVSSGTMRPEDLIPAFTAVLRSHYLADGIAILVQDAETWMDEHDDTSALKYEPDDVVDTDHLMERMVEALETFAPPYCYFGANEGDGADYGFWPDVDSLNREIENHGVKLGDGRVLLPDDGLIVCISDHGNVGVYEIGLGDEVWSVV